MRKHYILIGSKEVNDIRRFEVKFETTENKYVVFEYMYGSVLNMFEVETEEEAHNIIVEM